MVIDRGVERAAVIPHNEISGAPPVPVHRVVGKRMLIEKADQIRSLFRRHSFSFNATRGESDVERFTTRDRVRSDGWMPDRVGDFLWSIRSTAAVF